MIVKFSLQIQVTGIEPSHSRAHSSHRVTHGPIPGAYENRANAAELSDRGGGDAIGLGPEFLLEFRVPRSGSPVLVRVVS